MNRPIDIFVKDYSRIMYAGGIKISCLMSDGSYWVCDVNGENWAKDSLSETELTAKFKDPNIK